MMLYILNLKKGICKILMEQSYYRKWEKEEKIEKVERQREINSEPPITKIEIVKDIIDNPTTK